MQQSRDGPSAKKVQDLEPSMFLNDVEPMNWLTYFTYGGIGDASVIKLEVTFDRLFDFKMAVVGFWREIDKIRMAGI
jgi:hypothetical protein